MAQKKYPKDLLLLITYLTKLPGIGKKTAERFAFNLLQWDDNTIGELGSCLINLKRNITLCKTCGCIRQEDSCFFCDLTHRNANKICVIASPRDVFSIEETNSFNGLYHVIDHLLSPLDGYAEDNLHLDKLIHRIKTNNVKEVILALDSTLEGDATSLFLKEQIEKLNIPISRLAFGLPVGSSLEYIDEGTLSRALTGRQSF
jgi:recombination protein RecR